MSLTCLEVPVHPHLSNVHLSPTLRINEKCQQIVNEGRDVYRLGFGQSPFPVPDFIVDSLRFYAAEKDYLPVQGLKPLRDAIAQYYCKRLGLEVTAEQIMVGPGSKELLFLLQYVLDVDLLLPSPSWVSYGNQASIMGKKTHYIHTDVQDKWKIRAELLEEYLQGTTTKRPMLLVLNTPGNPTGQTYSRSELQDLTQVMRRYGLFVIADEIYSQLEFSGETLSLASLYPEGTFVTSGISKHLGAGGWRLGHLLVPKEQESVLKVITSIASETFSAVSAPIQYAAVAAYQEDERLKSYLLQQRSILQALAKVSVAYLKRAGVQVYMPDGAFYLFLDFTAFVGKFYKKGITSSDDLCKTLLEETAVALLPGTAFFRPSEEFSARLAYVDFDGEEVLDALETYQGEIDERFLREYCPKVLTGVDKILAWLKA